MGRLTYPDIARISGTGLVSTGLGLLCFVLVTVVWGDPFTRIGEASAQGRLDRQLAQEFTAGPQDGALRTLSLDPDLTRAAAFRARKVTSGGGAAGRIRIADIGVTKVLVDGTGVGDLKKGPGIYSYGGFPGMGRPVGVAGHRTTYGAPFLDIDKVERGRQIVVDMPYGRFTYTVTCTKIIEPDDWSILQPGAAAACGPRGGGRPRACSRTNCEHLVLTACHPKYSAAQRIALFARLTRVELRGAAR